MLHTVSKACKVLDLFSMKMPEWGVNEAAKALDIPKSTMSGLMASLASQGVLERTEEGRYRLGWRLVELSHILVESTDFYADAHRVMQELVDRWGEIVRLSVIRETQIVCIETLQGKSAASGMLAKVSSPLPLHASSIGKVMLAYQDWQEVKHLLPASDLPSYTRNTITSYDELVHTLYQVREQGYACDREELLEGLSAVSAPVYNASGRVIAGIGMVIPAYRFSRHESNYTAILLDAARTISKGLGYSQGNSLAQRFSNKMKQSSNEVGNAPYYAGCAR